jgi:hypothetical protein
MGRILWFLDQSQFNQKNNLQQALKMMMVQLLRPKPRLMQLSKQHNKRSSKK